MTHRNITHCADCRAHTRTTDQYCVVGTLATILRKAGTGSGVQEHYPELQVSPLGLA